MDILLVGILIILLSDKTSTQLYNNQFDTIERYEMLIKSRYDLCQENRQVPRDRDRIDRDIHSRCCGYCSTKSSCYKYRTCCVDIFDSLAEAQSFMANTGSV